MLKKATHDLIADAITRIEALPDEQVRLSIHKHLDTSTAKAVESGDDAAAIAAVYRARAAVAVMRGAARTAGKARGRESV